MQDRIIELSDDELDSVTGGLNGFYVLGGTLAGIVGAGLTVAGLGTPISIGGAALAVEGATLVAIGLAS